MTMPTEPERTYGEVFTRRWVVETLLDLSGYTADRDLGNLRILEPSCGSGAFLGPIVERLIVSALKHGRSLESLYNAVTAFDIVPEHVRASRVICVEQLVAAGLSDHAAHSLAACWVREEDFLLAETTVDCVDVVIGNPPYIRYDDLPQEVADKYRKTWTTMRGRGDIYVGFFERSLGLLKNGGVVGFICADRWMRNQYGSTLRQLIGEKYAVEQVWTLHDVDAFEAQVSAYPAITLLSKRQQGTVLVAETTRAFSDVSSAALVTAAADLNTSSFEAHGVRAHRLPHWFQGPELWPTGSPARLAMLELLNDQFPPLQDVSTGTRVSIGIATGADQTFITKDANSVEFDRLLPLAMRRDLMSGQFQWQGNYLINPWGDDGKLVPLSAYPQLAQVFQNSPSLRERFIARKNPSGWYRTIDKVQPGLAERPKLLIQDMKATIHPVLEPGGHYPHHNLYYVTSEAWDMEVLGGILLSRIAQAFIEAYCVRMRGGTLRFQAQYLKRIRVPRLHEMNQDVRDTLRHAFRTRDVDLATESAAAAYGIDPSQYDLID
jgi:adenine-specific DNA-methyltransferase